MNNRPHAREKKFSNKTIEVVKNRIDNNVKSNRPSPIREMLKKLIKK